MALGEFSLIDRFFKRAAWPLGVDVGVGDDAAVMSVPSGHRLVACKDVLVQGRHFFADVSPHTLGHKSLAVNLSDLAAMGATPLGCLLGIGLPTVDETWLESFVGGFSALAQRYDCPLVGGDTVGSDQGLFISVTALGTLPDQQMGLLRSAAQVDDDIWVSGTLGAPDMALRIMQGSVTDTHGRLPDLRTALECPEPRVALGQRLLGVAHAAIDISDGLTQDLSHVLKASNVGAVIDIDCVPVHRELDVFDAPLRQQAVLHGGDVYELCFTAPTQARATIEQMSRELDLPLTRIGQVCAEQRLYGRDPSGRSIDMTPRGFDHFSGGGA